MSTPTISNVNEMSSLIKTERYRRIADRYYLSKNRWLYYKYFTYFIYFVKAISGILVSNKLFTDSEKDILIINTIIHCITVISTVSDLLLKVGETIKLRENAGDAYSKLALDSEICIRLNGQDLINKLNEMDIKERELIDTYDEL